MRIRTVAGVVASAGIGLAPLVAAPAADANATGCANAWGSSRSSCFDVQTAVQGNAVTKLVMYREWPNSTALTGPYQVTPLMLDSAGRIRHTFKTYSLPIPGFWDHGIVVSCNQLYAGSLVPDTSTYDTPCHLWPEQGYKLGMRVTMTPFPRESSTTYASPVDIKLK